ncbi:hypothetical protein [Sphingomonas sp. Leaf226]|uniref:hypothetical protein n=1 Tax=Sphingomonas sp. Leaf226 TaxID=1735691 RepID=UPI000AFB67A9|nr:hypothetical protein [Sphingomonas sp. Leaf226]
MLTASGDRLAVTCRIGLILLGSFSIATSLDASEVAAQNGQAVQPYGRGQIKNQEKNADTPPKTSGRVQDQNEARRAQDRAARAEKYQQDELRAQQVSAAAAEQQARLSVIQALFGTIGTILLVWTLWYSRSTAKSAERSAHESFRAVEQSIAAANAAVRSAKAAETALSQADSHFAVTNRAWVTLASIDLGQALGSRINGGPPVDLLIARPVFKNMGGTPALDVRVSVRSQFCNSNLANFNEPDWDATLPIIIPPQGVYTTDLIKMNRDQAEAILSSNGNVIYILDTNVRYKDFFSHEYRYTRNRSWFGVRAPWSILVQKDNGHNGMYTMPRSGDMT